MARLAGRVAAVTGAGSGIGRAVALRFAKEGAAVAAVDINAEAAAGTASAIESSGGRAVAVPCDVSRAAQVEDAHDIVDGSLGAVDILVNAAGVVSRQPLLEVTDDDWARILEVNLYGPFYCIRRFAPDMVAKGGGKILNITSVNVERARPERAPYAASKGGLQMLTRAAAVELARHNIQVNAIAPGLVDTPINRYWMSDHDALQRYLSIIPAGRPGEPEEIASAAVFLCSDESSYVTGATLFVDGGLLVYHGA